MRRYKGESGRVVMPIRETVNRKKTLTLIVINISSCVEIAHANSTKILGSGYKSC